jgi:hypothetical protein
VAAARARKILLTRLPEIFTAKLSDPNAIVNAFCESSANDALSTGV